MRTHSNDNEILIGKNIGEDLMRRILQAKKSVKIVSPYLSASYVKRLVKLARNGVDVTLITANDVEEYQKGGEYDFTHTDLIKQKRHTDEWEEERRDQGIKYSLLSLIIPALIFFFTDYTTIAVIGGVISFLFYLKYKNIQIYSYTYYSPIKIKVILDQYMNRGGIHLIHSKIYVIDEEIAYVGSLNYTHSAFTKNYETLTAVKDKRAIKEISEEVDSLFKDPHEIAIDIQEWGKLLYPEPPN